MRRKVPINMHIMRRGACTTASTGSMSLSPEKKRGEWVTAAGAAYSIHISCWRETKPWRRFHRKLVVFICCCTDLDFFTVFTAAYKNISVQRRIFFEMHHKRSAPAYIYGGFFSTNGVLSFYNCSLHQPRALYIKYHHACFAALLYER